MSNFFYFSEHAQQNMELLNYLLYGEIPEDTEECFDEDEVSPVTNKWYCSD